MKIYDHIIVIGVDGAGTFIKDADTPNFDRIFKNGAVTNDALVSNPPISAECWGSMLIGTSPKVHGLTNDIVEENKYPKDSVFPSVFRRIREKFPNDELGAICNWYPIINGIIEDGTANYTFTGDDDAVASEICKYIQNKKPNFLFVQFDSVDGVGHGNGFGSKAHLNQISIFDGYLGRIFESIENAGILDSTLFCVISDHGGQYNGEGKSAGHGDWTDPEKYVTFGILGKTVNQGADFTMNIRDLSAMILYAYGIEAPGFELGGWTSQLPKGLFKNETADYYDISDEDNTAPRFSNVHGKSEPV